MIIDTGLTLRRAFIDSFKLYLSMWFEVLLREHWYCVWYAFFFHALIWWSKVILHIAILVRNILMIFFQKSSDKICYWADDKQSSWIIALWWLSVSLWRICITFIWPSGSQTLPAPSSQSERHLRFALIRLCLALLFIISITSDTELLTH